LTFALSSQLASDGSIKATCKTRPHDPRICPVFDNGTSMGHEIVSSNFNRFADPKYIENYVSKGWHHMKWALSDTKKIKHDELLIKLIDKYPETQQIMLK
jgi:hypothetical protein